MDAYQINKKILFLDDEVNILRTLSRLMTRLGYEVKTTVDPQEAIAEAQTQTYGVIVSDHRMPQMKGTEFLAKVKEVSPSTIRILLTGYADIGAAIQAVNESQVYKYLNKPWNDESLKQTIHDAFKIFNMATENAALHEQVIEQAQQLKEINEGLEKKVTDRTAEVMSLNKRLEKSFLASIKLMGSIAHLNNEALDQHSKRVSTLCVALAKEYGWGARDLFEIQVASYLHDIGYVPNSVPVANAIRSFELMQMIPNLGKAYAYVRYHRNVFDGEAGKKDLKQEAVPLGAKILAVVNAYDEYLNLSDSAASATPYKALLYLKSQCPGKFDATVVNKLFEYLEKGKLITADGFELTVSLFGLLPGMILSRDLVTKKGRLILAKDEELTQEYISKIIKRHSEDPIADEIYVYKKSSPAGVERRVA